MDNEPRLPPPLPIEVDCAIIIAFPKGPHTTEAALTMQNVDLNQIVLAREMLDHQIRVTYREFEARAQKTAGIVIPSTGPIFPTKR